LFGDENGLGFPPDANADFFSTIRISQSGGGSQKIVILHHNYGVDSSVAAIVDSGPSSFASESLKNNTFRIYPSNESETDRLVTKALVLGDFESAVELGLSSERYAHAILLAVRK
jgi:protein transport protein SEC31